MSIRKKTMPPLFLCLAGLLAPMSVSASNLYSWSFTTGNCQSAASDSGSSLPCPTNSNSEAHSLTFGGNLVSGTDPVPTPAVIASAWASDVRSGGAGTLQKDDLTIFGGGLGIENRFQNENTDGPHAVSNDDGVLELVLFDFGVPISLNKVSAGYTGDDGDMTVLRFDGDPFTTIENVQYGLSSQSLTDWTVIESYDLTSYNPAVLASNLQASQYWIVAAHTLAFGTECLNDPSTNGECVRQNDQFKINYLKGTYEREIPPDNQVPVPSTLLLTALGLAWFGGRDRRFAQRLKLAKR